ncbi:MAG TPA: cation-translocating P-type ATPase [Mycobacteriales bacterium]
MAADTTDRGFAERGLSGEQVLERVRTGRTNDVPTRSSRSVSAIVRANVLTRFNALIGTLFVAILVVGPVQDSLFGFVILANTGIGIVQELRAKRTLDRLAVLGAATARVRRDGRVVELAPAGVVLDDVLLLGPGDKVVVDGTLLSAQDLELDESLLTGEAEPVPRGPGEQVRSGSFAVAGTGAYRATRVGRDAYAAALAAEASRFTLVRSELRTGINRFLAIITWLIVPTATLLAITQFVIRASWHDAVRGTVAGVVTMVPEGLVLLTSIAFAVGVIRLGRRQCLVQELPAIEGLARVDVVCADKTGTLTEPGMALRELRPLGARGDQPADLGRVLAALGSADPRPNASLRAIIESCPDDPHWTTTEVVPFSSARGWSGAAFEPGGVWVLGAPERLLADRHGHPDTDTTEAQADDVANDEADEALRVARELSGQGHRVMLLARATRPLHRPDAPHPVQPAALVVLEQVIRPDAAETLRYFARQGVRVKVISGDTADTVGAIARRLDLPGGRDPVQAASLPPGGPELTAVVDRHDVFGRVTPETKRAMVGALQAAGHTVAMTGDGVNDVLALKDADVGVAMGSGSDATRAVAQIVLLDNRFATLPVVVAEGRRVIGNIERVAGLFLTKTVYAMLLALTVGVLRLPFPFLPRHLTLVGALTIGIPAFFLALAPNTERARTGMVPRVLRFAIPAGVVAATASFAAYYLARQGVSTLAQERTAATIALAMAGFGVLTSLARPLNWWKFLLVGCMVASFTLVFAVPTLRDFFALPLPAARHWGTALAVGGISWVAVEAIARVTRDRRPAD